MSYFSYATSMLSSMLNNVAEQIGSYVNIPETQVDRQTENEGTDPEKEVKKDAPEAVEKEEQKKEPCEVGKMNDDEFELITDHELYVIMFERDGGVVTEENFFINLEESIANH
ncbi:Protein CBG12624 [Caenorhabditis briggsae]|uniref:Uncharacterized protein n=2 Tax=Caenorhabditis briggsae TaxID=6238 RepID=A0AAE9E3V4_CAEBR|nr:Protein CBG12624 [Caenorhabditis briggsae]ULU12770.1 hypothetical protein L3Y34_015781 [Caenorhabditis briggsae]UMM13714.1 hypothetical protein L5515_001851 [Caenorhabditis briggsae]CAP31572.1 Protein CBG12624 [Caenorhabditis briggsae]